MRISIAQFLKTVYQITLKNNQIDKIVDLTKNEMYSPYWVHGDVIHS